MNESNDDLLVLRDGEAGLNEDCDGERFGVFDGDLMGGEGGKSLSARRKRGRGKETTRFRRTF